MTLASGSTPSFSEFDPREVPYQARVIDDMNFSMNWATGLHEILLSGSVGSAKSILAAHIGIKHLLTYPRSRLGICRRAMPDLRDTIYTKLVEHLEGTLLEDGTPLREGKHYFLRDTTCSIRFWNGSEVIARSWADGNYKKLGSLELSAAIVEELTENDDRDEMAIKYIRMRVGRLMHVPQSWIVYCTNPDEPGHFAYKYFDIGKRELGLTKDLPKNRHVYFSNTAQNKFLPPWYIKQLEADLPEKLADRMIRGLWRALDSNRIYYAYGAHNFPQTDYELDPLLPIAVFHDFNIGVGKPMSGGFGQYDPKTDSFHIFAEVVVETLDTEGWCEEAASRGLYDLDHEYEVYGDASGASKTANSKKSNYDIIKEFLAKHRTPDGHRINYTMHVPKANPAIRDRHIRVNAYCKNALGKSRLYVYKKCKVTDEGMRLTAPKKGGQYAEDDSKSYQHITTALGYWVHRVWKQKQSTSGVRQDKIR